MQISARNTLPGRVKSVQRGAVNAEVVIELDGGSEIVSIITLASADRLKLAVGMSAFAIIKSSDVMIGTFE